MLTKKQMSFYEDNGYVIVDNVLSKSDLGLVKEGIGNILDAIIERARIEYPNHRNLLNEADDISRKMDILEAVNHKYIAELHDCMATSNNPYIAKIVSSENVLNVAKNLLGITSDSPLFMTSSMGIFSMPNNTQHTVVQWHTDTFYTCKDGHYVQFWAPIVEDATDSIGAIHILPGSHKKPFYGETRTFSKSGSDIHKFSISEEVVSEYVDTVIELEQGQGIFFNQYLVHRGGVNKSDRTRFCVVSLYHSMSSPTFTPYYLSHPKSKMTSDEFFDEVMLANQ